MIYAIMLHARAHTTQLEHAHTHTYALLACTDSLIKPLDPMPNLQRAGAITCEHTPSFAMQRRAFTHPLCHNQRL